MTRLWTVAIALAISLMSLTFVSASGSSPVPAAPTQLAQKAGNFLPAGAWTNRDRVEFRFNGTGTGAQLTPEVEIQTLSRAFTDHQNHKGTPQTVSSGANATFVVPVHGFHNGGLYH